MNRSLLCCAVLVMFSIQNLSSQKLALETFAMGLEIPVSIAHANDDRLFVVEKRGRIKSIQADGSVDAADFLDIRDRVNSSANERGLLGLAFHPDFQNNGLFFVYYTGSGGTTVVSKFNIDQGSQLGDPDSEVVLLTISQPFSNHNGGCILFGPDGYLYIGSGDGGAAGDPGNVSQDHMSLLGKMLRIDVDNGNPYAIPPDNPFADDDFTADEIWALGLRNPWRFSFDKETGDMWIGDVGQDAFEEIDFQPADSKGGENYGWKCYEGDAPFQSSICGGPEGLTFPIYTYVTNENINGCSVTGGYVYRGQEFPALWGKYIFADFCTGQFWILENQECNGILSELDIRGGFQDYSAFGEDQNGELYVAAISQGAILKITTHCTLSVSATSQDIDCFGGSETGSIELDVQGSDNFEVSWSNGETVQNLSPTVPGCYCATITDGDENCSIVKCFEIEDKGLEFENPDPWSSTSCGDGFLVLVVDENIFPNYSIQWYLNGEPIGTGNEISINESGTYAIQFISGNCASELYEWANHTVVDLPDQPTITFDEASGTLFGPEGFVVYSWYLNGELLADTGDNTWIPTEDGEYQLIVEEVPGCPSPISEVYLYETSSIYDDEAVRHFSVSPNPFTSDIRVNLDLGSKQEVRLSIFNIEGKKLLNSTPITTDNLIEDFNLEELEAGTYILHIEIGAKKYLEKIVKQ